MDVHVVDMFSDNHGYLVVDTATNKCGIVDGAESGRIVEAVKQFGVQVEYILTTHSHWDHAGGNSDLKKTFPDAVVVAGKNDGAMGCELGVGHMDTLDLGDQLLITVLDTPCHTAGHVCYHVTEKGSADPGCVFTGDTLFIGGCGNFNSGTPEQMYHAMVNVLGALAGGTLVCCGHNYTEKNLRWALEVEPTNEAAKKKLAEAMECNSKKRFIPSTIEEEKSYNPFMRCVEPSVQAWAHCTDPVSTILKVRRGKDEWGRRN